MIFVFYRFTVRSLLATNLVIGTRSQELLCAVCDGANILSAKRVANCCGVADEL